MLIHHFQLMAQYNQWMNQRVYAIAATLDNDLFRKDLGAFFGSIFGTLNHNVVGDQIWLSRFLIHDTKFPALDVVRKLPVIKALDQILYSEFSELQHARDHLDKVIIAFCDELKLQDLEHHLVYRTTDGELVSRHFGSLMQHFFNHQTHHRGQVTTLFNQHGLDIGVTDLLELIPEQIISK